MLSKHHFVPPSSFTFNFSVIANIFTEWRGGWRDLFIASETHFSENTPKSCYITRAAAQVSEVGSVTLHRAQWPGPSRRKYLSLLRQKIFRAKKNIFTDFGRQETTRKLGGCLQIRGHWVTAVWIPWVFPCCSKKGILGLVWSVIFPRIEIERVSPCLALNRFISTTISPGPRARHYLTCRDVIPRVFV